MLSQVNRPATQVYPTAELERIWRWNLNRAALQNRMGEMLFVPKIMFFEGNTQARSAVVWPDACPIFMPKTDIVIVLRDELSNSTDREITVVDWPEIKSVVQTFPVDDETDHYCLDYDMTPVFVDRFIRTLPIVPHNPDSGLANDSVLNAEMVNEITSAG